MRQVIIFGGLHNCYVCIGISGFIFGLSIQKEIRVESIFRHAAHFGGSTSVVYQGVFKNIFFILFVEDDFAISTQCFRIVDRLVVIAQ